VLIQQGQDRNLAATKEGVRADAKPCHIGSRFGVNVRTEHGTVGQRFF
jgi:hypothetical protein